MTAPVIKGWCPGAHKPMMSGDGLVVRVRPFQGQLDRAQILGLCDIANTFGNGMLDLTSRANLQIRGIAEADHHTLLERLDGLRLIDKDPAVEAKRNILVPATWQSGDLTDRLYNALLAQLPALPDMPGKVGFAIDTSRAACLSDGSADFRFELSEHDQLILRADGCDSGQAIAEKDAMRALRDMVDWFLSTGGADSGRMIRHVSQNTPPEHWLTTPPRPTLAATPIGQVPEGTVLGAPFGKIKADDLTNLVCDSGASAIRLMINRTFLVMDVHLNNADGFVSECAPIMDVHACPGAPFCPQATVKTMEAAYHLAAHATQDVHVSGCAKGCAHPRRAAMTFVGRDGRFDLVLNGHPWDDPDQCGIDPAKWLEKTGTT